MIDNINYKVTLYLLFMKSGDLGSRLVLYHLKLVSLALKTNALISKMRQMISALSASW